MRSLAVLALLLAGCGAVRDPRVEIFVCDRSDSAWCSVELVRSGVRAFLAGNPPPGSQLTVLATGCDTDDLTESYEVSVPSRWGAGVASKKRSWRKSEEERLASLQLPPVRTCSGLVEALWYAGRMFAERGIVNKRLVLVGDLRQVSQGLAVNFERWIPSPEKFLKQVKAQRLLPNLGGVVVEVYGVHSHPTPDGRPWTAKQAAELRAVWERAFAAMGVASLLIRERCPFGEGVTGERPAPVGKKQLGKKQPVTPRRSP